jgi:hypothetical protein
VGRKTGSGKDDGSEMEFRVSGGQWGNQRNGGNGVHALRTALRAAIHGTRMRMPGSKRPACNGSLGFRHLSAVMRLFRLGAAACIGCSSMRMSGCAMARGDSRFLAAQRRHVLRPGRRQQERHLRHHRRYGPELSHSQCDYNPATLGFATGFVAPKPLIFLIPFALR